MMKQTFLSFWLFTSLSTLLLFVSSLEAHGQGVPFGSSRATPLNFVVVTFNTGTSETLSHDSPPDDGYTSEHAEISDKWYGNGLAWVPAVEATRRFLEETDPDVVVFQEMFYSAECANIPPEATKDFVCENWAPGDPTVAQVVLGKEFQIACNLGKPDKCAGVNRRFGAFRGCNADFCLNGLAGAPLSNCGGGSRIGSGIIDLVGGGAITIVNVHGTSGFSRNDIDCRVRQFEQIFLDLGDGEPAANGEANVVMGDLNTDPGRLDRIDASAERFNDFADDDERFHFISDVGSNAPPTYLDILNIDHVVSDVFNGSCRIPGVTAGQPDVIDAIYFDHKPVICELEAQALKPLFDVKANGSDGPLVLPQGSQVSITASLNAGTRTGVNADWWVAASTTYGNYWYTLDRGWVSSDTPIVLYSGPLFNFPAYEVLNYPGTPKGSYTFYTAVDLKMDGKLNGGRLLHYDSVNVTVE